MTKSGFSGSNHFVYQSAQDMLRIQKNVKPSFGTCGISIITVVVVALHYDAWTFIMDIMADYTTRFDFILA